MLSENGRLQFIDWPDFEDEFRKDFTPLDAEATAVNTLETSSYFQGKRTVDDYLDQFRDLIYDLGYTDPKTIVVKFRRGLDRWISAALAGMALGRPSDTKPEAWYDLAVLMDQNRVADEAFQASHRAPVIAAPMPRPSTSGLLPRIPIVPPAHFAHLRPSLGNPVPMDIDAARKADPLPTPVADAEPPAIGPKTATAASTSATWMQTSWRLTWRTSWRPRTSRPKSRCPKRMSRLRSNQRILCPAAGEPCAPVA